MPVDTILFDLDCTLTDRRKSVAKAADLLLKMYPFCGCCSPDRFAAAMWAADHWGYRDRREFFEEVIERTNWVGHPPMEELLRFWNEDHPRCSTLQEDAQNVLRTLRGRGIRLGIVTNGQVPVQSAKIRQLGLEREVESIVISDAVGFRKPDPRIYQHALASLNARAESTLFVGDHAENDVAGAMRVGIRGVWLRGACDYPREFPKPWRSIERLSDLLAILPGNPQRPPVVAVSVDGADLV